MLQKGINLIAYFIPTASLGLFIACSVGMGGRNSLSHGTGNGYWIYGAYYSLLLYWRIAKWAALVLADSPININ